jgi:hypothetical protein
VMWLGEKRAAKAEVNAEPPLPAVME